MAQVKFSASISPEKISKNEYAQLRFIVANATDVEQFTLPNLKDFNVITQSTEQGTNNINGIVKKYVAISYTIIPKGPGRFTILPASATIDGKKYQSNPVNLEVSNTLTNNSVHGYINNSFINPDPFTENRPSLFYKNHILKKGEDVTEKIQKNIFIKIGVDKTACFVGEPIIVSYKLYTALQGQRNIIKSPSFNGFSVIDLQQPGNTGYEREKLNGKEYDVYTIRKVQLYALQPGNFELEQAEVENDITFIKDEYARKQPNIPDDLFNEYIFSLPSEALVNKKITIKSKPLFITVNSLPEANKPKNFKGAVGFFTIESALAKNTFTTDDVAKLIITVNGNGNLQLLTAPDILWPDGLERFEPKVSDDIDKTTVPVLSRKIIEIPFTAAQPGTYTIPAVEFSFFDPKDAKYKTIATKPISFSVTKGAGTTKNITTIEKQNTKLWLPTFFSNRLSVIGIIAVLIITGLIFWLKRDIKKEKLNKMIATEDKQASLPDTLVEEIFKEQQNPLLSAKESLLKNDGKTFYKQLDFSLKNYLSKKFNIPFDKLNKRSIAEAMDKTGIPNDTILQLQKLADEIEWHLYTPFAANEKKQHIYEKANELIQLLNTYKVM